MTAFDSDKAVAKITRAWLRLGNLIAATIPAHLDAGEPEKAIRAACCAEACFWKATGESESHDVKDVLKLNTGDRA